MPTLYVAPTINYAQTTLNGAINNTVQTITLNSTSNLQAPGYIVIDRTDSEGTATPSSREVVSYTGISGNDLTGCTRGADGSTARSHSNGAVVETMPTVGMWNSLATILATAVTTDGYLKAINSPVSIAVGHITRAVIPSVASIAEIRNTRIFTSDVTVANSLNLSSASVVGVGLFPVFNFVGNLSGPTTLLQTPLSLPKVGTWSWFSVMTRTVASGASVIIDINLNGSSIFEAGTRPTIPGGGTFVSTASINTKAFSAGNRLSWDYDTTGGHVTDLIIQGGST